MPASSIETMLVNGKEIAAEVSARVREEFAQRTARSVLQVIMVGSDAVTEQFVRIKKRVADSVGVELVERRFPAVISTEALVTEIQNSVSAGDGIIVQLPLPEHIDVKKIQSVIPASHDVDCLGTQARRAFEEGNSVLLPPVVGACKEILSRAGVDVAGKSAVVIGKGILVGAPSAVWLSQWGANVVALDEHDFLETYSKKADIIVLGAGVPHLLKPDMIKDGVVILDAGTSESGGKVVGDADPSCAEKAALLTPVPGGIGPVAVAKIFENLLVCTSSTL